MKRLLLIILLFLLIGAVMNIAVAWGCGVLVPVVANESETCSTCDENEGWAVKRWRMPGLEFIQSYRSRLLAPKPGVHAGIPKTGNPADLLPDRGSWTPAPEYINGARKGDERAVASSGWPMLSMWCEYDFYSVWPFNISGIATPIIEPDYRDYYPGFRREWPRVLPLRLIWPGSAVNTILYAAFFWLVLRGPFVLRRRLRQTRGCCLECGYDLRGDFAAGCPECGWNREKAEA